MEAMTIGKLAQAAAIHVETVRYYERRGLIQRPAAPQAGYRRYPPQTVDRIRFIKKAQTLGFTLAEVADLLALRVETGITCDPVRRQALAKIEAIAAKINSLQRMKETLESLVQACDTQAPTNDCPVLQALEAASPPD